MQGDQWYQQLQAFRIVIRFIDQHRLSQTTILKHVAVFQNFVDHYRECRVRIDEQPALTNCRQATPGYTYQLVKQGALINLVLTPCYHRLVTINDRLVRDKFLYYDFADHLLQLDITNPRSIWLRHPDRSPRHNQQRRVVLKALADFDIFRAERGLYLYGPAGGGKTHIFIAFAVYLVKKYAASKKIAFVNASHLIASLRANAQPATKPTTPNLMSLLKTADVLFIDDFGVSKWTTWVRDEVYYYLLNYFLINHKLIFLNSNFSPAAIKQLLETTTTAATSTIVQSQVQRIIARLQRLTCPLVLA